MDALSELELQSERIKNDCCPSCGAVMKDKGSYIRCTRCSFGITNGRWCQTEGYCIEYEDEPDD